MRPRPIDRGNRVRRGHIGGVTWSFNEAATNRSRKLAAP